MDRIVISGVKPYDGSYDLDLEAQPFTTREWRWIKQITGYLPTTVEGGFNGGDPDLIVSLAVIALRRSGTITNDDVLRVADKFADVPFDGAAISFQGEETAEDDARPPDMSSSSESESSSPPSSGPPSSPRSVPSGNGLSLIGSPDSESELATSPS